jgi:hypothetical protein
MARKYFMTSLFLCVFSLFDLSGVPADDAVPDCSLLTEKASGDMAKYSVHGDANGPVFFSGISCAIKHRNKVLCAMEMVSFDATAKVFDYYSGEELAIAKAYFWLDEKNNQIPIVAFSSQENAEKYKAESGNGVILDYTGLSGRDLN